MKYKVISLFSGGGGLDLGFLRAGFDIIWAIDNNQDAVNTYKKNIGNHIVCEDITTIDITKLPQVDIVVGGPPCQAFSLIGNRDPNDDRAKLVWRYIDILKYIKPKVFVFENVPGILSAKTANNEKVIDLLFNSFRELGYELTWKTVNAAEYGVPQLRQRVIIIGVKSNYAFNFPIPSHSLNGESLPCFVSVEQALSDLPQPQKDVATYSYNKEPLSLYQKIIRAGSNEITEHALQKTSQLDDYIISHVKPGGNYMDIPEEVQSVRVKRLKKEGGRTTYYGRLNPVKPSFTINTYFNRPNVGCNIHYSQNRLITVREALRLQSFPDCYQIVSSSKQGKHLIVGNAVPPLLSEKIAVAVKKCLEGK